MAVKNKGYFDLDKNEWRLLVKFINIFDDNTTFMIKQNREQFDIVWQKIVMIRKTLYKNIDHVLRKLFELYFITGERRKFFELNKTLLQLNHVLDQRFYNYCDSETGLIKFIKLLKTSYEVDNLVLKEMEVANNMFNFVEEQHHEYLIKEYKYLKGISLPVKDYREIRLNLITLLKKFKELYPVVSDHEYFYEIKEDIVEFKKKYITKYLHEHKNYHEKLKNFYNILHNLPEYKTLAALSKIKTDCEVKPIKKYVENFFPDRCNIENLEQLLKNEPKCYCGFTLGSSFSIPPINKITPVLKKGISNYRKHLQHQKNDFPVVNLPVL